MGWEATEHVVHERVDGVLVASRVTRDVEWDQWQRSLALALVDLEASTDANGIPVWDAFDDTAVDPDGEFHFRAERVTNHAQAAIDRLRRESKDEDADGVTYRVDKVMARTD